MTADTTAAKRLQGVRTPYASAPTRVRAWVERALGAEVVTVRPRVGGMSPAVAASLQAGNGRTAFLKAVGPEINPDTPTHFRHEADVLQVLPAAPYRADLLGVYDDGDWVGILLADVEGDHPDWSRPDDFALVLDAVRAQTAELTPPPAGLPGLSNRIGLEKYVEGMSGASADELAGLPSWAVRELPMLTELTATTLAHQEDVSFCHWDIRHDNLLIRAADRQPIFVDWGMSRLGARWSDLLVFGLEWAELPLFDELMASGGLTADEGDDVTGFLAGIGCYLGLMATHEAPPGLPNLNAFRRELSGRCLEGVRRRLGLA